MAKILTGGRSKASIKSPFRDNGGSQMSKEGSKLEECTRYKVSPDRSTRHKGVKLILRSENDRHDLMLGTRDEAFGRFIVFFGGA